MELIISAIPRPVSIVSILRRAILTSPVPVDGLGEGDGFGQGDG